MRERRIIPWFVIAAAALAVAFAPIPFATFPSTTESRTFHIQASQYAYSPGELRLNLGDTVTIELTSTDVAHGLYLDGYGLSVQADPGQAASLTFVANRPGSFRFRCNVRCGAMHPFMIGKLIVGGNTLLVRAAGLTLLGAIGMILAVPKKPEIGSMI